MYAARLLQRHVRQRSQERHGGCVAVGHVQRQPAAIVPGKQSLSCYQEEDPEGSVLALFSSFMRREATFFVT